MARSTQVSSLSRRSALRLMGGATGLALLPPNLGCVDDLVVVGSNFIPTPDRPLTPNNQFFINSNNGRLSASETQGWALQLNGLVARAQSLSMDDLMTFPVVTYEATLECVGNTPGGRLISSAAFTGVALRDVLDEIGIDRHARGLRFRGLDGYTSYLSVDAASAESRPLLVYRMNAEPLPLDHGAPLRVLFPGRFGMFSAKWLQTITAIRDFGTYGALRGFAPSVINGKKRLRSRVDVPGDGREVTLHEPVAISGLAATAGIGIRSVQVGVDGDWQDAELTFNGVGDDRSDWLWTLWRHIWTPTTLGRHVISVRAYDAQGRTQSSEERFPYDGSAIHSLRVLVRE